MPVNLPSGQTTSISIHWAFPNRMVDAPPFLGLPLGTHIPMVRAGAGTNRLRRRVHQHVHIAFGRDGSLYVLEITKNNSIYPGIGEVLRIEP
jgi:hypothetical protein